MLLIIVYYYVRNMLFCFALFSTLNIFYVKQKLYICTEGKLAECKIKMKDPNGKSILNVLQGVEEKALLKNFTIC